MSSFNATRQTCYPRTSRYVEENVRHESWAKNTVRHLDVQDVQRLAVITKPITQTHAGTVCAQNWRRVKREQARVDARKQEQSSSHKRGVSEEWDRPPEKFWRMGGEDVTMRQDITATSGASSSSADIQTEDLEDNEQLDAHESAASLLQAEGESSDGRMFIGIWEHVESGTHNQRMGDKVAGD